MTPRVAWMLLLAVILSFPLKANDTLQIDEEAILNSYFAYLDSIEQTLEFEFESVTIRNGLARVRVPAGFKYLNGKDSEMILTDLWGNPPSEGEDRSLGMLMPKEDAPFGESSYVINITYTEDGYVDDADAKDIDYDELLETMQEDTRDENEYRMEMGYEPVELVGWASAPYYDAETKKLHWAKELKFGEDETHTLNYNIRILGRKGYLQLNVIGGMEVLPQVKEEIGGVLSSVNFNEGYKYSDFDPNLDEVAAYGIGALIAGKVMAKAGLFAKIGLFAAKFWKIIAIGGVALLAGLRKLFGGTKDEGPGQAA